jgi:pimeloyl-ACP methyl ester carboxylesterase
MVDRRDDVAGLAGAPPPDANPPEEFSRSSRDARRTVHSTADRLCMSATATVSTRPTELQRSRIHVEGRRASCATGGDGLPVLFLHGWGLGDNTYRRTLRRLVDRGCRVHAPSLPGFGDTAELPRTRRNLAGYAAWVDAFMTEVGIDEPVLVLGHSFGGGVAIQLAHDFPERVAYLVPINSVGAAAASKARPLWQQLVGVPLLEFSARIVREMAPTREGLDTLRVTVEDFAKNFLDNPRAVAEVAQLARRADLSAELAELGRRQLPMLVLWSERDRLLPLDSFDAVSAAVGAERRVVHGQHSWLLVRPDAFGAVLGNVVEVQVDRRWTSSTASKGATLRGLLARTGIPPMTARTLVTHASPLWMMSDSPQVLAGDLALCHPPLADGEVRAMARPLDEPNSWRLTVVAHDRKGLLAATAAALTAEGLSVTSASAVTLGPGGIALHALACEADTAFDEDRWAALGVRLREMETGRAVDVRFRPVGRASVTAMGTETGSVLARVTAPDQPGLLWAICQGFADQGVGILSARAATVNGVAYDDFIVDGPFDTDSLADALSEHRSRFPGAFDVLFPLLHRCAMLFPRS